METPINDLTVTMFRNQSKAPKLKLKAAHGRHFLPVLREMLRSFFPIDTDHSKLRYQCVHNLYMCYYEMDHWVDGGPSTERIEKFSRQHLILYGELSKNALSDLLWRLYPKHHLFCHIGADATDNPKSSWNYALEGEIGDAAIDGYCIDSSVRGNSVVRTQTGNAHL